MNDERLIWEAYKSREVETMEFPMLSKPNGVSYRGKPDWKKFKVNGYYRDGDVLRYIYSQHKEFEDDHRVKRIYKLISIDPNKLEPSEWEIDDYKVEDLSKSNEPYPPIVINKNKSIVDGGHRLEAAKVRGDKEILVFLQQ
jgi:hypothetical protein